MDLEAWLDSVRISSVVDIVFMTLVVYGVLVWLRRTRRAALVFTGILIVAISYLMALWFDLVLTVAVLQGFFAVFLLALVIIFQEELRYLFERIAQWSLRPRLPGKRAGVGRLPGGLIETLARTLGELAEERTGALVVIRGRDLIARHLRGGVDLNGELSEALLKSLFDPHSIGHDGALVLDRDRVERFGCHLPLSSNFEELRRRGTRHAAALGLSELSDALCLVVSEERGTISVARDGTLRRNVGLDEVREIIERFYDEVTPEQKARPWRDVLSRNWREKIIAVNVSLALWFGLVHGSETVYRSFAVPVELRQLSPGLSVETLDPDRVRVTLSGPRRAFLFVKAGRLRLAAKAWDLEAGERELTITGADLSFPENVVLERLEPRRIVVRLGEKETP